MIIPRGIIYHSFLDDLLNLLKSIFGKLDNKQAILKFENKFKSFNQSKYCLMYPFARSAFWSILKSCSLKEGDEIILPPIQIKGMIEICKILKLKPIIVDIDQHNLSFNLKDLKKKITNKTKVILLTYLYGIVPNLSDFNRVISKTKIIVIEDFSQCLFGKFKNKFVGNFGDYGIYSLSATKTLDTYGGGVLVTNKKKNFLKNYNIRKSYFTKITRLFLFKKIFVSAVRNFFLFKINFFFVINFFKILNFFGVYDYQKFLGSRNKILLKKIPSIWFQSYTSLQAVHGIKFIDRVKKTNKIRRNNVYKIQQNIGQEFFCTTTKYSQNVYWQCAFFSKNYKKIQNESLYSNIDIARPSIMLLTSIFNLKNFKANKIYEKILLLPCYHTLKKSDLKRIILTIKKICQK